ncbi:hypothetical protein GCM10007079_01280 [Nocardiopsis terrae]|nr:hypothetical protein GCM10007079_01280 [Nocardiopsis terrae]
MREAANRGPSEGLWRLKRARQTIRHEKYRRNAVETVTSIGFGLSGSSEMGWRKPNTDTGITKGQRKRAV